MTREELIKKWLDNSLTQKEQKAFEQLEDYNELIELNAALKAFKSPEFNIDKRYNDLNVQLQQNKSNKRNWLKPLLRVAAVLAICFSVYYFTTSSGSGVIIDTQIAEQSSIILPDDSAVELNANSSIVYDKEDWAENRALTLNGEAFFKVAKGKKFDVITSFGTISVLGTEFNIKERDNYFEVVCYEGLVAVKYKGDEYQLPPGNKFKVIDGKLLAIEKEFTTQPDWLRGESSYSDVTLSHVISELNHQYDIKIKTENLDVSRRFTGSFTHKNLDLALKSITIPLNLSYSKTGNSIVIKGE